MEINNIYNIDCFDGFKEMEDNSVTHVFTSPPYNRKRNDKYTHHVDIIDDYFGFLCNVINESLRVSSGHVFFNIMKNYYNKQDVFKLIGKYHDKIIEIIIWEKTNPLPASGKSITNAYEFFIIFGDKPLKSSTTYTKNILSTSVNYKMTKDHKAIMKQEVADWFLEKFTTEDDIILDPFMGAGTTAISCLKFNRRYIGFELAKEYVELSSQRIDEYKNSLL
jgi:DNA modification methylase